MSSNCSQSCNEDGDINKERVWTEIKRNADGVSVTTYHDSPAHDEPEVVDEAWWTWAEFTGCDTMDLPVSRTGRTTLDGTTKPTATCPQSIVDILATSGLGIADISKTVSDSQETISDVEVFEGAGAVEELLRRLDNDGC
jgi:hypothetical protein